ncbi:MULTISPECIES: LysE family translocator [Pseudoalteromonas]|uniref:Transporter n=1 Tax=Pseudoalteromonas amylolytica TaxID=1859457 RepID=A0A1S1MXG2_9GAMM|nr:MULTISPECIES: LysE family translocator [Pseudoalteromonas]OHU88138.1 transporter [Pseudoalteromonas sp. JW3]OHU91578.1 transporter [Pseudoalteromonas amylolytica]
MELSTWLSLATICILGAMSPGPSLAVVLRHSLYNSALHGIVASVSHGMGVGLYAVLSLLGLAGLITHYPLLFQGLVIGGAIYLAYMGIKILTSTSSGINVQQSVSQVNFKQAAQDGFAIAFLNPKLAIFFLALFSQFIDPDKMTVYTAAIMCATVLVIDTLWYFFVSVLTARAKQRFDLASKQQIIDKALGVVFLLLALRVVVTQLS